MIIHTNIRKGDWAYRALQKAADLMTPIPENRDPFFYLPQHKCRQFHKDNPGLLSYTDAEFRDAIVKAGGMIANYATGELKRAHELGGDVVTLRPQGEVESYHSETGTVTMVDGSTRMAVNLSDLVKASGRGEIDEGIVIIDDMGDAIPAHMNRVDHDLPFPELKSLPDNEWEGYGPLHRPVREAGQIDGNIGFNTNRSRRPGPGAKVSGSFKKRKR